MRSLFGGLWTEEGDSGIMTMVNSHHYSQYWGVKHWFTFDHIEGVCHTAGSADRITTKASLAKGAFSTQLLYNGFLLEDNLRSLPGRWGIQWSDGACLRSMSSVNGILGTWYRLIISDTANYIGNLYLPRFWSLPQTCCLSLWGIHGTWPFKILDHTFDASTAETSIRMSTFFACSGIMLLPGLLI